MYRASFGVVRVLVSTLVVLSTVLLGATVPAEAETVASSDLLLLHNQLRYAVGAPTIPADARIATAAQSHANYDSANNVLTHYETIGLSYFTGYGPHERVAAAGLSASYVSEVATSFAGGINGVHQLWDAPYHRVGMMHPNAVATGWGHSDLSMASTVADIVYDYSIRPADFIRSPAAGQTAIPTSWNGVETPSPLPPGVTAPVGYPIVLVYSQGQSVDMRAAQITGQDGANVSFYYAPQESHDAEVIVPQRPLAANTTYHVRFDINVNGQMVTNEWDFSTGATIASGGGSTSAIAMDTLNWSFVDETPFPSLAPGTSAQLTIHLRNSGTATWRKGVAGSEVRLGIAGDDMSFSAMGMNVGWVLPARPAVQSETSVAPGGIATFVFSVRAPASVGTYRIALRPVIDGRTWLDDQGLFLLVTSDYGYHSSWASQSAYPTLAPGAISPTLTITFANTGSKTWTRGVGGAQANLGVVADDTEWAGFGVSWPSANRVATQSDALVPPGGLASFAFQVRAPAAAGVYRIALRPVIDGTVWMEDQGVFLVITVP